jgi:hypothetical protein
MYVGFKWHHSAHLPDVVHTIVALNPTRRRSSDGSESTVSYWTVEAMEEYVKHGHWIRVSTKQDTLVLIKKHLHEENIGI